MVVRGKGAAESAVQVLENESSTGTVQNSTTDTSNASTELEITGNNDPVTSANDPGAEVQLLDPVTSANEDTHDLNDSSLENDTVTIPQKDTTGVVMQSRDYTCGPAAFATVLQNMGFNVTEEELIVLSGTDTTGTSMYGLVQAAQSKV